MEEGFKVHRFDFSGNGQSEGIFSESIYSKQISDMKVAASFLTAEKVSWFGLAGHSMGGFGALYNLGQHPEIYKAAFSAKGLLDMVGHQGAEICQRGHERKGKQRPSPGICLTFDCCERCTTLTAQREEHHDR